MASVTQTATGAPTLGLFTRAEGDAPRTRRLSFPNRGVAGPLFPQNSARLLLAELLWQANVIDQECRVQQPFIDLELPKLIDEEIRRAEDLLDAEVTLTDRSGTVNVWEKATLGEVFDIFASDIAGFEGSIVSYILGPSYYQRYLQESLRVTIPAGSPILERIQHCTAFPNDIDVEALSQDPSIEKLGDIAQARVESFSQTCSKDAVWMKKYGFTKMVLSEEEDQDHLILLGLKGKFLTTFEGKPCKLDLSSYGRKARRHMFQSDALHLDMRPFRKRECASSWRSLLQAKSRQMIISKNLVRGIRR